MLASTLRRPRWAMPITTSATPRAGGRVEERVEQDDGRLGPFEAEALLPDVAGVEEALEDLGGVEAAEDVALLVEVERGRLDPSTCCWIQRFCSGSWMCMYSMPSVRQ